MSDKPALLPGHIDIEGCVNFRDAGGWIGDDGTRMRTGVLYRSDDPIRLTVAGRAALRALDLAMAIDLRQAAQVARSAGFLPPERTRLRPLVDRVIDLDDPPQMTEPAHLAALYDDMLTRGRAPMAAVLDDVAVGITTGSVLVHCVFGKDRTGLVVAAIQMALDMPTSVVVEEYSRSDAPTNRRFDWMLDEPVPGDADVRVAPRLLFSAPAEAMALLVDALIERHGSTSAWVDSLPLQTGTLDRLRAGLLEH